MRNMVIEECKRLLVEIDESPDAFNWNNFSNSELLDLYGNLRIEIETEEFGDEDNNGNF